MIWGLLDTQGWQGQSFLPGKQKEGPKASQESLLCRVQLDKTNKGRRTAEGLLVKPVNEQQVGNLVSVLVPCSTKVKPGFAAICCMTKASSVLAALGHTLPV